MAELEKIPRFIFAGKLVEEFFSFENLKILKILLEEKTYNLE